MNINYININFFNYITCAISYIRNVFIYVNVNCFEKSRLIANYRPIFLNGNETLDWISDINKCYDKYK